MRRFLQILSTVSFVAVASAQVPSVRSGSFELGGFLGASYGVDNARVMGGGNLSYAVSKVFLPYVEYSYFPGIQRQISTSTVMATYSVPISDFHGGVHIRIPIKESRMVPYGVFGVGGLSFGDFSYSGTFTDSNGTGHPLGPIPVKGSTAFAVNYGAGLRYYINPRYGFRLEAKGYKPRSTTGFPADAFMKAEFGFFIQLR